jgi:cysteine desulfurase
MEHIYLDYAASTPINPDVLKEMEPYFLNKFGNPGSLHYFGQEALKGVDEAREKVAAALGADYREIFFTGSATEANNWALRGTLKKFLANHPLASSGQARLKRKPKIIVSAFEHESILETANDLAKDGIQTEILKVNKDGFVDLAKLKSLLDERTILVSVMYANNEIGSIQPIEKISGIIAEFKKKEKTHYPLFHTDAVQALQFLDCNVNPPAGGLGVDLMSLSGQKIYGPKGIGCLYVKNRPLIAPFVTGGSQEMGLRGGTLNVPAIVGFGKAVELISAKRESEGKRLQKLCDELFEKIKKIYPKAKLNGSPENRLPNNLNIYFPGWCASDLLIKLDLRGLSVSAGAACTARAAKPSHVIKALGYSDERASGSLRLTIGRPTTYKEIAEAAKIFKEVLKN